MEVRNESTLITVYGIPVIRFDADSGILELPISPSSIDALSQHHFDGHIPPGSVSLTCPETGKRLFFTGVREIHPIKRS